jgi:5-methylcytosine-specific restriction endonuclease McrA
MAARVVATEVDHIVPAGEGGALYDPDNLRSSCKHRNRSRENQRNKRRKPLLSRDWPKANL